MAKSVLGVGRDTPLGAQSCPRKLAIRQSLAVAYSPRIGESVRVCWLPGSQNSGTQNSTSFLTRAQALNKSQCGASPRNFILEKSGGKNAQGNTVGCSPQGTGITH